MQIYENLAEQYRSVVKGQIGMMKSLEQMALQQKQLETKKENQILLEKYKLQLDYYNSYIMNKQIELLKKDIENLSNQLEVENVKKDLDMTTDLTIETIEGQLRNMKLSSLKLENGAELLLESLKTKLNIPVEEKLNIELNLPQLNNMGSFNLPLLLKNFKEKSI